MTTIDQTKLQELISKYKADFNTYISREIYKWEAVKEFQDNWNIDDDDFADMLSRSLAKTKNLLDVQAFYPKGMILNYAKDYPDEIRALFAILYEEDDDITQRIDAFKLGIEKVHKYWDTKGGLNHYQTDNVISTYLWLRFPDKYYIYKPSSAKKVCQELNYSVRLHGMGTQAIISSYELFDLIADRLKQDKEYTYMLKNALTPNSYPDDNMKTATVDFVYYVYRYMSDSDNKRTDKVTCSTWDEAIIRVLGDENIPLKGRELAEKILKLGYYHTTGKTPEMSVSRNLTENYSGYYISAGNSKYTLSNKGWAKYHEIIGKRPIVRDIKESYTEQSQIENNTTVEEATSEYQNQYNKNDFLSEVFMSESQYDSIIELLNRKKNIILQGAPGVGKTFAAKRLAYSILGCEDKSKVEFIQFHQSYSYEDFVLGYKPNSTGFSIDYGPFYKFCKKAAKDGGKHFFIIDEINRGNLSKIFGELLMLIEATKRDECSTLLYTKEAFRVPDNVYIIGMMNTADRSLAMIDYALRRRFSFFDLKPGYDADGFKEKQKALNNEKYNNLVSEIINLNKKIVEDDSLGYGFEIGHSYLCYNKVEEVTDQWLHAIVNYDIIPLLSEYWFDNRDNVKDWAKRLNDAING